MSRRTSNSSGGTVLHFAPNIIGGGAETMMRNLIEAMHGGPWRTVMVALSSQYAGPERERLQGLVDAYYELNSFAFMRPSVWLALRDIMREEQPDVVQTWMHRADIVGGLVARSLGIKHIVWGIHSRGIFRSPGESNLKLALYQQAMRAASHAVPQLIVSCSTTAIQDHCEMGYPESKMKWIPNGISTERFVPDAAAGKAVRAELGIPADAPVIGFMGRFHPVKDLPLFLEAVALHQARHPDTHFILCGGHEDHLEPRAYALWEALPLRHQVHCVEFRSDAERLYNAFSLLSLCSQSEALPMVLLEAMACGVPCVTTDVGDCASVIGKSGFVAAPNNPEALAKAWEKVLELSPDAYHEMSVLARDRVESHFSIHSVAEQYEATYRSLIKPSAHLLPALA